MYEEWLDKYEYLIELGKSLTDFPEKSKTDDKLIKGCQSRVWLDHKIEDGKITITYNILGFTYDWEKSFEKDGNTIIIDGTKFVKE